MQRSSDICIAAAAQEAGWEKQVQFIVWLRFARISRSLCPPPALAGLPRAECPVPCLSVIGDLQKTETVEPLSVPYLELKIRFPLL